MTQFIFFSGKGGVGKTSSAVNIATGLSYLGKTLIIDLDSQANIATTRFFEMLGNTLISNEYLVTVRERKLNEVLE